MKTNITYFNSLRSVSKIPVLIFYIIASLTLLFGCSTPAKMETRTVSKDEIQEHIPMKKTKSFKLGVIQTGFDHGTVIGIKKSLLLGIAGCVGSKKIKWEGKSTITHDNFYAVFYDEFHRDGYQVLGDPRELFPSKNPETPEFVVGAKILSMKSDLCSGNQNVYTAGNQNFFTTPNKNLYTKRDVSLKIEFKFYSTSFEKVMFEIITESSITGHENGTELGAFLETFRGNVKQMIQDEKFNEFITSGFETPSPFIKS